MWLDIVSRKMYVTGGVGSTGNEGFGEPYSLPNISAYAETCAVLMFADAEPQAVSGQRRRQVHRRPRARHLQQRAVRRLAVRRPILLRQSVWRAPATAATRAGSGPRSNAVRRIWCGSSRRCPATSTRRTRRAASTSICTCPARRQFSVGGKEMRCRSRARCRGEASRRSRSPRRRTVRGADQIAHSGMGAQHARARRRCIRTSTAIAADDGLDQRHEVSATPDQHGYVYARSRSGATATSSRCSSRLRSEKSSRTRRVRETRGRVAVERGPMVLLRGVA